jgi:SAM-dependent methyltransferase
MTDHTGAVYHGKAAEYALMIETKPIYAYYERPAVLSLLPSNLNLAILDAGCGSGWYTKHLVQQGASVTAIDLHTDFLHLTKVNTGNKARVIQADLTKPLNFAQDNEFDIIVCSLVMHYIKNWLPTLQEFHRILKANGFIIFSTHHPFNDWKLYNTESYFGFTEIEDEFDCGIVRFYRRSLTAMCHDLNKSGFVINKLLEPQPAEELRHKNPTLYARLNTSPCFLVIRAQKVQ